jgi:hypothetical protein
MIVDPEKKFEESLDELLKIICADDHVELLKNWVLRKSGEGLKKEQIYTVLLYLHKKFSDHPDEKIYDRISDFLDRFTSWAKGSRILPEEPDVE